jgi:hypothetical protein
VLQRGPLVRDLSPDPVEAASGSQILPAQVRGRRARARCGPRPWRRPPVVAHSYGGAALLRPPPPGNHSLMSSSLYPATYPPSFFFSSCRRHEVVWFDLPSEDLELLSFFFNHNSSDDARPLSYSPFYLSVQQVDMYTSQEK